MSITPFTGFSYATGLAALGQGINSWKDGVEKAQKRELLLSALGKGDPEVAALAAADQPGLALQMWAKKREDAGTANLNRGIGGLPALGGGGMPGRTSDAGTGGDLTRTADAGDMQPGSGVAGDPLDLIMKHESAGRNVKQDIVPEGGGYNPSVGRVTGPSSASGYFQMIDPTWRSAAKMAGIDTSQYPTAMSAPYEVQRKAASALFAAEGFKPWAPYNAALRKDIARAGGTSAFRLADDASAPSQPYQVASNSPVAPPSQAGGGGNDAPPTADEVPQLIQAGVLPEQIRGDYLAEMWQTQPQIRQAVQQWRSQRGGALPASQGAPATLAALGGPPAGGQLPPDAQQTLANLGSSPAARDAQRVATQGGPRMVLSGQYPLTSAASPGGAPPGSSRNGPAAGIPAASTPEEVAAAERASGMVYTDGTYPTGLLPPAPNQVARGGNAPPPAAPPQGAGEALPYRNPNGGQPMPIAGGSGPVVTNGPASGGDGRVRLAQAGTSDVPLQVSPGQFLVDRQQQREGLAPDPGKYVVPPASPEINAYRQRAQEIRQQVAANPRADAATRQAYMAEAARYDQEYTRLRGEQAKAAHEDWQERTRVYREQQTELRKRGYALEDEQRKAEAEAPTKQMETESKLRGEFTKRIGTFQEVHDAYGRVISATEQREANPDGVSPASDISLIFGYMKMLDPGSVVREGEFATAQNAGGIPDRVVNAYNKALRGEFLTPEQRQDFVSTAERLYGQARKGAEQHADRWTRLAKSAKVDPNNVVELPPALVAPKIGSARTTNGAPLPGMAIPDPQGGGKGAGQGGGKATAADRFQQLIGSGLSKADAYGKMAQEGY